MNRPAPLPQPTGPTPPRAAGPDARTVATRRVARTRTLLVGGAVVGSLAVTGAFVALHDTGTAAAASGTSSSSTASTTSSSTSQSSSLVGSGSSTTASNATSSGS